MGRVYRNPYISVLIYICKNSTAIHIESHCGHYCNMLFADKIDIKLLIHFVFERIEYLNQYTIIPRLRNTSILK